MLLRNLFEAANNEVAIIFGRFNPPHKGHRAAWEMASQSSVWFVGTNESTVGPKDPLPFEVKVEAMKTVWPEVAGHIMPETSWLTMASEIYKKYPKATLLCLTDEDWVTKTIVQYNGKEGAHGFYNFPRIEQKATPRLSSATALRDAVAKGDREAFSQAAGVSADTKVAGKPFFDLVAEYLLPYSDAPKKVAKKKKEPVVEDDGKEFAYQGYKIKFTPTQLVILKGGDVALTRPGDFSNPSKQQMIVARKYIDQMWQKEKEHKQSPNISHQHELYGVTKEYNKLQKEISQYLEPFNKERMELLHSTGKDKDAWMTGLNALHKKYHGSPEYKELTAKHAELRTKLNALKKGSSWNKKDMAEANSNAMANIASRLTNKDDGKVAKLRAAGDKRREDQLKGRNIAKRNESVDLKTSLQELSNDMLGKYKKAAGVDAKKADAAGDFKRGDKRFKGINQATMKQFDNDAKKNK